MYKIHNKEEAFKYRIQTTVTFKKMPLVKKIKTTSRNGEISALTIFILKAFEKNNWRSDTYLTPVIEKLTANNIALTQALNRLKSYSPLAKKDHVRNMEIRSLFKLMEGYACIPLTELKEAALVVKHVLEQYGLSIQNENYASKSANIESLLNDLAKPDVAKAVQKLQGVPETITALAAAQQDFEKIALQQAKNQSERKNLASASELKKEIITEINTNLVAYMNTMAKVNPTIYKATAQTIAELINKNNESVTSRYKTKGTDTKEQ